MLQQFRHWSIPIRYSKFTTLSASPFFAEHDVQLASGCDLLEYF